MGRDVHDGMGGCVKLAGVVLYSCYLNPALHARVVVVG